MGLADIRVVGPDGAPIPHASWRLGETEPHDANSAKSSFNPGQYTIDVIAEGYDPVQTSFDIIAGKTTLVTVGLSPQLVHVTKEKINISETVYFETNKATIKPQSFALLDAVAEVLVAHPELSSLRVEGHTDSRGGDNANLLHSQRRAKSVRQYLIAKGVKGKRLLSAGLGETQPIDSAENEEAWSKNRRVEFIILERTDE